MTNERVKEEMLVIRAQAGSGDAFALIYRIYQPSLLRFAFRITGDSDTAQDAVQDAWIMLARTLGDLKHASMFRSRAFQAVRWRATDQLRKTGQHSELEEDTLVDDDTASKAATSAQISRLIDRLPPVERQTIHLFYLEELAITEIALVMETRPGTVKSRLHSARARLRQQTEGELK